MPLDNIPSSSLFASFEKVASAAVNFRDGGPLGDGFSAFFLQGTPDEKQAMVDRMSQVIRDEIADLHPLAIQASLGRVNVWLGELLKQARDRDARDQIRKQAEDIKELMLKKAVEMTVSASENKSTDMVNGFRYGAVTLTGAAEELAASLRRLYPFKPVIPQPAPDI